jgi:regulatory protein
LDDKVKARARNNAYALLRQRPQSEYEIRNRLKLKGYDEETIEEVVENLKRIGDIDDQKFAHLWVESRMQMNPMGDVVLKYELKVRGVSDSIVEATLAEKHEKYDEYEVALNMAKEQFERFKKLDRRKATKRVYDFLLRRGFAYDTIRRIIEELK